MRSCRVDLGAILATRSPRKYPGSGIHIVFDQARASRIAFGQRRPKFATTLTLFADISYSSRNDFVIRQSCQVWEDHNVSNRPIIIRTTQ